ncbi:MAG: biopolymer transporter Tol [Calditrichaeota bacterium]|nr:biopolymer transporter Tol [Calditrichota bacterium]
MRKLMPLIFILMLTSLPLRAQFGKNKVQYKEFDWHYVQSEHFDVYFYKGSYKIATFVANIAETSYVQLQQDFNYDLSKRVVIIVYKSHNDFQQTNVVEEFLPEGVGGVTELFKNRVVIPYEGSYDQFRHVIHHELVHAVMNDMLYGGSLQSIISGQVVPVPTWFAEGLAEFLSVGWDTRADMILRDATISGYLPPIEYLSYYLAYQGGQSLFRYISEKYGRQKVGEILHKIKGSFRFEGAFKSALGINLKELSEEWQKQMRKEYWPDIADRKEASDIARQLTDHKKKRNFLNSSPALSPRGDKLVFLSDRGGKQSIYLMDVIENKIIKRLIKGETSTNFEELKWLTPGMGWSPDGRKIVLAAKAGDQDAIYIYDLDKDDFKQYKFNLDGIYSATWSPAGDEIAFIGNMDGASDIYIFNVKDESLKKITDDVFSDGYPKWSSDGQKIVFVSDRGKYVNPDSIPKEFDISKHNFRNNDIYIVNKDGSGMKRITDTPYREADPIFAPDNKTLFYVSDRNGIFNIYRHDLEKDSSWAVTNLLTGAFQLSLDQDGKQLVFTSFEEGGWDIYLIKNPLELGPVQLEKTVFFKRLEKEKKKKSLPRRTLVKADSVQKQVKVPLSTDYSKYVFADMARRTQVKKVKVRLNKKEYKFNDGHYKVRNYKVKFSPDIVNGAAYYNTLWGFQGYTAIAFSDVLGNHKIFLGTNLVFDLRNSYINFQYWYLPRRTDYGITLFHYANTYLSGYYGLIRYRNYGAWFLASRPFNKFTRVDFYVNWWNSSLEYLLINNYSQNVRSILPGLRLVHDTSEWYYTDTAPRDGFRGSVSFTVSPHYTKNSPEFATLLVDLRKYIKLSDNYSLGLRINSGISRGKNPQQFFLGGEINWLNRKFNGDLRLTSIYDVYFSEFITPLRGARFYEKTGNNVFLFNGEFRFPFIPYMQLGFPPMRLGNIKGVIFTDIGTAWDSRFEKGFKGMEKGRLKDIVMGYGVGTRVFLSFLGFILKYDVAWRYDLVSSSKPMHYISIGVDF